MMRSSRKLTVRDILDAASPTACNFQQQADGSWRGHVPGRKDEHPSCVLYEDAAGHARIVDQAGKLSSADMLKALGLRPDGSPTPELPEEEVVGGDYIPPELGVLGYTLTASYVYRNSGGVPQYEHVRFDPPKNSQRRKDFRCRREVGSGQYVYTLKECRLPDGRTLPNAPAIPYRLDELIAYLVENPAAPIFITEGEKDADRLWSLGRAATCNRDGAKSFGQVAKFLRKLFKTKRGEPRRIVVVLQDNDDSGAKYVADVGKHLARDCDLRVLLLPDLPPKGDVSDWLDAGGTVAELLDLASKAPPVDPKSEIADDPGSADLPIIVLNGRSLDDVTRDCQDALTGARAERGDPVIFTYGGQLARIITGDGGRLTLRICGVDDVRQLLCRYARPATIDREGVERHAVPTDVQVRNLLAQPRHPYPSLAGIIECPQPRPDGSLIVEPGFDTATGLYLASAVEMRDVAEHPTPEHVAEATAILDSCFGEFPYDSKASRANLYAALLTPIARPVYRGTSPIYAITATSQGSGKSTLMRSIGVIATGHPPAKLRTTSSDEELGKSIFALLLSGSLIGCIDNIPSGSAFSSPVLEDVATSPVWQDRLLGSSKSASVPNRTLWIVAGNNVTLDGELPRRTFHTRLQPREARKKRRQRTFRVPYPDEWAQDPTNRGDLLWALLTLVRNWFARECPSPTGVPTFESFTDWARVIGGILEAAGIDGFLGNADEIYERTDTDETQWRNFLLAMHKWSGGQPRTVGEILGHFGIEPMNDHLPTALAVRLDAKKDSTVAKKAIFGKALAAKLGCIHDGDGTGDVVLCRGPDDSHTKSARWFVKIRGEPASAEHQHSSAPEPEF